jgi:hypothetical protein
MLRIRKEIAATTLHNNHIIKVSEPLGQVANCHIMEKDY